MLKNANENKKISDDYNDMNDFRAINLFKEINSVSLVGGYSVSNDVSGWDDNFVDDVIRYLKNRGYNTKFYNSRLDVYWE